MSSSSLSSCMEMEPAKKRCMSSSSSSISVGKHNVDDPGDRSEALSPLPTLAANYLCEDELEIIFTEICIDNKDLLNFRLVSRRWRNAASSILLKRDACHVKLTHKLCLENFEVEDYNRSFTRPESSVSKYMFCNSLEPTALIQDLAALISTSPKFPASTMLIDFGRFTKLEDSEAELLPFFKLNGKLVKTLCPAGRLPKKELLDIFNLLCPLLPNLECLDLSHVDKNWIIRNNCYEDFIPSSNSAMIPIPIKRLRLRSCYYLEDEYDKNICKLIKIIMNSASTPNLKYIHNVDTVTLKSIVDAGKGHLVHDLNLFFCLPQSVHALRVEKFAAAMITKTLPMLSVLSINLQGIKKLEEYPQMAIAISSLIATCKETLEHLTIFNIDFSDLETQIDIPRIEKLKYLHLKQDHSSYSSYSQSVNDFDEHRNYDKAEGYIFRFTEEGLPKSEYFPRLQHLKLTKEKYNSWSSTLMKFFALNSNCDATVNVDGSRDWIPTVTTLEICESPWPSVCKSELISRVFPNIRALKIEYSWEDPKFQNSIWVLCPLAESVYIYNASHDARNDSEGNVTGSVDKFFTGFRLETCKNLRNLKVPEEAAIHQSETNKRCNVYPSLTDLKYLKELKIHFINMLGPFGSHVTGVHVFQKMPKTSFMFTYCPATTGKRNEKDYLLSLASNVQVICE